MEKKLINKLKEIKIGKSLRLSNNPIKLNKQLEAIKILNRVTFLKTGINPLYVTVCKDVVYKESEIMDSYAFEKFAAERILKHYASSEIEVSQKSRDDGIDYTGKLNIGTDILSFEVAIYGQVKLVTTNIGVEEIRSFLQAGRSKFRKRKDGSIKNYILQYVLTSDLTMEAKQEIKNDDQKVQIITLKTLESIGVDKDYIT